MRRYYYDLHLHSCLSPCGDNDSTPNSIAGIAKLSGLELVALTDHNTSKNCPAFFEAAERYGIIPVAGMELTTSEDIHLVCLFPTLDAAMKFDETVDARRVKIKNRPDIFGEQLICDSEDNIIGHDENLLPNATEISLDEAFAMVCDFGGVAYPAHIDRQANGVISVLGTFPATPAFTSFELHDASCADEYIGKYGLQGKKLIVSSDAHYLTDIRDAQAFLELDEGDAVSSLIEYLR